MNRRLLAGTSLCALLSSLACDKGTSTDPDSVGTARFAIAVVPADVLCVRINAASGGGTNQRLFDVTPGAGSVLTMGGLPAGPVTFSGDALPTSCGAITPTTTPTWAATPVSTTITAGAVVDVTLVMVPAGGANVTIDFRDAGVPTGTGGVGGMAGAGGGSGGTGGAPPCVDPPFVALPLNPGWTVFPFLGSAPAAIRLDCSGIVQFRGTLSAPAGTSLQAFNIPVGLRPPTTTYVPVDMIAAAKGRLIIEPTGTVTLQAFAAPSDATGFTSLDGASYALSSTGFTPLTLGAGWTNAPFFTRNAAISVSNGIVRLQGAISSTGTDVSNAFTIPDGFRPPVTVYVVADMFAAAPGRLIISPDGAVFLQGTLSDTNATGFTSLEGVWYPLTASGYTALPLNPGWSDTVFGTRSAAASVSGGLVRLQGALSSGTSTSLFTLPVGMRPAGFVWTPLNVCAGKKGRLNIDTAGTVNVQVYAGVGGGTIDDATCFISLEGVSFGL